MPRRKTPVYAPRWLYRFFAFLERLPVPLWALGLGIILIGGLADHLYAWREGIVPTGQFNSYLASLPMFSVSFLTLWIFLDSRARVALSDFFTNRGVGRAQFETALADFISLPSWTANLLFLVGTLSGFWVLQSDMAIQPLLRHFLFWGIINYFPASGLAFMLIVRILRQVFLMRRFFRQSVVDIFNPKPVYALSRYASMGSITWLIINYIPLFLFSPGNLFTPNGLETQAILVVTALIFFFAPLASINQRMRQEKENLLARMGEDQKAINNKLHQSVNSKNFSKLAELRNAVSALKEQREVLHKLPTWPWQSDTLRNLLTPLMLPIIVYLIQRYLAALVGF